MVKTEDLFRKSKEFKDSLKVKDSNKIIDE